MIRAGDVVTVLHESGAITGPYRVIEITETNCVDPSFYDSVTMGKDAPLSNPYNIYRCRKVGEKYGFYWLIGYDDSLNSVWVNDRIIIENKTLLNILTLWI